MQFFTIHWSVIMTTRYMYRNILIFKYKRAISFSTFSQLAQFPFLSWRIFVSSVGAIRGGQRQNGGAFGEDFYKEEGGQL